MNDNNLSDFFSSTEFDRQEAAHIEKMASDEAYWVYLDEVEYHIAREDDCPPEDFE